MNKAQKKDAQEAVKQIKVWNKHLAPHLFKAKMEKMSATPYYFFRGTNHLFYNYFSNAPRLKEFSTTKSDCWIQADLHAYNYGIYCNNQGELVYDLNDFDESCIANYQFDLWRMASSMVLIAKENEFNDTETIKLFIESFTSKYIQILLNFINHGNNIIQQTTKETAYGKLDETMEQVEKKESRKEMLKKWTSKENHSLIFDISNDKLLQVEKEKRNEIIASIPQYINTLKNKNSFCDSYFEILDIAQRISTGTGSLGTPRYYVLIKGNDKGKYEQRILDFKLQNKPSLYYFLDKKFRKNYDILFKNEGERHKLAYQALNSYTDSHLGWVELKEGVFSVRERSPYKSYFQTKLLNTPNRFNKLAEQWGQILAISHIRASKQFDVKSLLNLIDTNKKRFINLVAEVALEYASYNSLVYKAFMNELFLGE